MANQYKALKVDGKTLFELSLLSGVDQTTIRSRYNAGKRGEELTKKPLFRADSGETIAEISARTGVNVNCIRWRKASYKTSSTAILGAKIQAKAARK